MSEAATFTLADRARATWAGLATRERVLTFGAAALVLLALLWWLGVQPALATLRSAEAQHRALDAQLLTMRRLSAEAASLQGQPRIRADDSLRALDASVRQRFGAAGTLNVVGERATVTLRGASPDALAQWLAQARTDARALPVEARLAQNATRTGWDGSIVLALPPP